MLSWGSCDSDQLEASFTGPGVYRQVISAVGFDAPVHGYSVRLRLTASNVYDWPTLVLPDAWRFDRPSGCQSEQLTVRTLDAACPSLGGDEVSFAVSYSFDGFDLEIWLLAGFPVLQPDPDTRYTLFALDFDHARSAPGPQDPAEACGGADERVCFVLRDARWNDPTMQSHPILFEPFFGASWEDGSDACFGDLAVQPSHWTAAKKLYR